MLKTTLLPLLALCPLAESQSLIWNQELDGYAGIESAVAGDGTQNVEAADDFDVIGVVERVRIDGRLCVPCTSPAVEGVWIRFYDDVGGQIGGLLQQEYVQAGDPRFVYDELNVSVLDVTLATPFLADGRHFLSVQLQTAGYSTWYWHTSGHGQPNGSSLRWIDHTSGGAFGDYPGFVLPTERDLAFELLGTGSGSQPPQPVPVWSQDAYFAAPDIPIGHGTAQVERPELADDFELTADIHRVRFVGDNCFQCPYPQLVSARVRFYQWTDQGPGATLFDATVPAGPGGTEWNGNVTTIPLPTPFQADGKYFVGVQIETTAPSGLELSTTTNPFAPPFESHLWWRDEAASAQWGPYLDGGTPFDGELGFYMEGVFTAQPVQPVGDPCGDWQALDVPHDANVSHSILRDLKVFAHDEVFAVGTRQLQGFLPSQVTGATVSYRFDGAVWTQLQTPSPEPYPGAGGVGLYAVDGVSPDDLWAGGVQRLQGPGGSLGSQILVMRWDGSQWTVVDTPITPGVPGTLEIVSGASVADIEAVASDDVWFVGNWTQALVGCQHPLAMHWDGSDFTVFDLPCSGAPFPGTDFDLEAVSAASSDDVWAVGENGYTAHFDGSQWTAIPAPLPGLWRGLFSVEAIAQDDVWAIGQFLDGLGYHAYAIRWDGTAWTEIPIPGGSLGLWAAGPDAVYAVGGGVFRWNGVEWEYVDDLGASQAENIAVSFAAVDGVAPCVVYAAGRHVPAGTILPFAARVNDGSFWSVDSRDGCVGVTIEDALQAVTPPSLGSTLTLAIDDTDDVAGHIPGATVGYVGVSLSPAPNEPCGVALPATGPGGQDGELLIGLGTPFSAVPFATPWAGPGQASTLQLGVPSSPTLIGLPVYVQGLLSSAAGNTLTNALDLQLGL